MNTSNIPIQANNNAKILSPDIKGLIETIENTPLDRATILQESLDLANKFRSSIFPWRGQFSPELVEIFLNTYSKPGDKIFDPFVGSGTTLFEAIRKGLTCYGTEINPSAIEMSRTVEFAPIPLHERSQTIKTAAALAEDYLPTTVPDLFSYLNQQDNQNVTIEVAFTNMLEKTKMQLIVQNIIVNSIIRYMNYRTPRTKTDFLRAIQEHAKIVKNIPLTTEECKVFHTDARAIPLENQSIDLIITSPPYINVFNYHQNNRPAMELVGWDMLGIARSEIGSNRKNRQNRFLTVVQYSLDMLDVLNEMHRLLHTNGRAIIIVGRESSVRGISFANGLLVAALAIGSKKFNLVTRQERKFVNKFGETIYEDVLHFAPSASEALAFNNSLALSVATWALEQGVSVADEEVRNEIIDAIERASTVQKSPLFEIPKNAD